MKLKDLDKIKLTMEQTLVRFLKKHPQDFYSSLEIRERTGITTNNLVHLEDKKGVHCIKFGKSQKRYWSHSPEVLKKLYDYLRTGEAK